MAVLGCREYRQGDNPRHIHAPSWARIGAPIVKEFREEYAHRGALVVDVYTPPMAQKRFAAKAGLDKIAYLSDYRSGVFGRRSGLLSKGPELLARAVIIIDRSGRVRYLQIVPELTHLPNIDAAYTIAAELLADDG